MWRIFLFFLGVPLIELYLLGKVSGRIGFFWTLILVIATGALGAALTRRQGLSVMRRVQADLSAGRIPAAALIDGIIILLAGAVLITPGILTDAFGFCCLIPSFRGIVRRQLARYLKNAMARGQVQFLGVDPGPWSSPHSSPYSDGPVIDVDTDPKDPPTN